MVSKRTAVGRSSKAEENGSGRKTERQREREMERGTLEERKEMARVCGEGEDARRCGERIRGEKDHEPRE